MYRPSWNFIPDRRFFFYRKLRKFEAIGGGFRLFHGARFSEDRSSILSSPRGIGGMIMHPRSPLSFSTLSKSSALSVSKSELFGEAVSSRIPRCRSFNPVPSSSCFGFPSWVSGGAATSQVPRFHSRQLPSHFCG